MEKFILSVHKFVDHVLKITAALLLLVPSSSSQFATFTLVLSSRYFESILFPKSSDWVLFRLYSLPLCIALLVVYRFSFHQKFLLARLALVVGVLVFNTATRVLLTTFFVCISGLYYFNFFLSSPLISGITYIPIRSRDSFVITKLKFTLKRYSRLTDIVFSHYGRPIYNDCVSKFKYTM